MHVMIIIELSNLYGKSSKKILDYIEFVGLFFECEETSRKGSFSNKLCQQQFIFFT